MYKKRFYFLFIILLHAAVAGAQAKKQAIDTSMIDYDELFNELDAFLDSLTMPRNLATINVGLNRGYFNYENRSSATLQTSRQFVLTPSMAYLHKSGLGISSTASVLKDNNGFNLYQVAATGSYDYIKNRSFMTGISYTYYFTKDSLPFYTSPLSNELFGYVAYRGHWWAKPMVSVSYGWGSRTSYEERARYIKPLLRGRRIDYTTISTTENVSDLSITASVKHDFYWLNVLFDKDYFRVTPQLSFVSGTQKFGFNQTNNSYLAAKNSGAQVLYNTENITLSDKTKYQPLALSARVRTEFSKGKFFLQPQVLFDYYFPAPDKNFTTAFAVNTGVIL